MSVPVGIEEQIYRYPVKEPGELRPWVRFDRPRLDGDIAQEFSGSWPSATMSRWVPALGSVVVSGGELQLSTTADTNAFPVVSGLPGAWFPRDKSKPWDHKWTFRFPTITGFGVWYRVEDLRSEDPIVEIKNDIASGYSIKLLGTEVENLGASHTTAHSFILRYTPATLAAAAQYELFRDSVSKGTGDATDRQAFSWMAGNQDSPESFSPGSWTSLYIDRIETDMTGTFEAQNYPFWSDKVTINAAFRAITDGPFTAADDGQVWGRLPWLQGFSLGSHERSNGDQIILTFTAEGYITGRGQVSNVFAGFPFHNLEVRIQSSQTDGLGRHTTWKEEFRGLCDEPTISQEVGRAMLRLVIRAKNERRLQMYHGVRGYSDNPTAIDGVIMSLSATDIMEDVMAVTGLAAADYNVLGNAVLVPRNWNWLGEPAYDVVKTIADDMVMRMRRNAGQTNPGRIEIDDYYQGTLTPIWFFNIRDDIVAIDFSETAFGMVAQSIVIIQHSDFPAFSYTWPSAPVPSYGAVIRHNVRVAQNVDAINGVTAGGRVLPRLDTLFANRELGSVVLNLVGQDWIDYDIECQISDPLVLGIGDTDYFQIIGWEYNWTPERGFLTTVHLANQRPEKIIQEASLDATVDIAY